MPSEENGADDPSWNSPSVVRGTPVAQSRREMKDMRPSPALLAISPWGSEAKYAVIIASAYWEFRRNT
ncbi:hypothetical protein [uncultured Microbacterium sp.]|uniref:hypothetical protein n=1 Tax=uncultured Microbacterium sp. TaxID=191216 RepID=UPI002597C5DC|nr:hypothetical protein [uncultured Microbacterium sp.]